MTDIAPQRLLKDGLYLGLSEITYFAQDRIGSTDLSRLFLAGEGWWWSSPLNPDYVAEPEDAPAKTFGKALHALVLEGDAAYEERFAIIPTKAELAAQHGELFCISVPDIEAALEKRGFNPKRMRKPELIAYCKSRAPDLVIYDVVEEQWAKANVGKLPVSSADHRQLQIMAEAVRTHPQIGPLFHFGADHIPLSEVSVLWTENKIRRRARLDQMLPNTTIDLKTLANVGGRPLAFAAGEHVARFGYFCQLADHHVARKVAYRLIEQGKVHGGSDRQRAWIKRFPKEAANFDYAWLMYQRPDPKRGMAPIIFPWGEDYGSPLHMDGIRARRKALETYARCMAQFGPDKPWTRVESLHTSQEIPGMPRVFLPHYIAQEAMPGEDEDL